MAPRKTFTQNKRKNISEKKSKNFLKGSHQPCRKIQTTIYPPFF